MGIQESPPKALQWVQAKEVLHSKPCTSGEMMSNVPRERQGTGKDSGGATDGVGRAQPGEKLFSRASISVFHKQLHQAKPETWQDMMTPMGRDLLELGENWAKSEAWLILQFPSSASGRGKRILGSCSLYSHISWCHHHQRTGRGSHWRGQEGVCPSRNSESTCKGHWETTAWLQGRHRKKTGGFGKLEWGEKETNRSIWEKEQSPRRRADEKSTCSTTVHIWNCSSSEQKKVTVPRASLFHVPGKLTSKKSE